MDICFSSITFVFDVITSEKHNICKDYTNENFHKLYQNLSIIIPLNDFIPLISSTVNWSFTVDLAGSFGFVVFSGFCVPSDMFVLPTNFIVVDVLK